MSKKNISIKLLEGKYAVCKLGVTESIPEWCRDNSFVSITRTADELSIVCLQNNVPEGVNAERDWNILKIEGQLDFSLIGIISSISSILAKKEISIFVISTFNTDYILVKEKNIENTIKALLEEEYEIKK